jgi:hypothetical protein
MGEESPFLKDLTQERLFCFPLASIKGQRAKSKGQRAKSKEQRAKGKGPRAKSKGPNAQANDKGSSLLVFG